VSTVTSGEIYFNKVTRQPHFSSIRISTKALNSVGMLLYIYQISHLYNILVKNNFRSTPDVLYILCCQNLMRLPPSQIAPK
jgi:hypothetical protein